MLSFDELMPGDKELGLLLEDGGKTPELSLLQAEQHRLLQHSILRIRLHRARLSVRKEMNQLLRGPAAITQGSQSVTKKSRGARSRNGKPPDGCRDLFAGLSEYRDGRMEPVTCDQMRPHIEACPACVAFVRDLRAAVDRCRPLAIPCDSALAPRLRSALTGEYLRMLAMPTPK